MAKHRNPPAHRPQGDEKVEDVFIAKILEISNWAQAHTQTVVLAGVTIVVLIASGLYYRSYRGTLQTQAASQLEVIQQRAESGDIDGAKTDLALYVERFEATSFVSEARLVLGQIHVESGEAEEAIAVLEPMSRDLGAPIAVQAAGLLGAAYEEAGRWEQAEFVYLRVADEAELSFQVREALTDAARIRMARGDETGAIELYDRILDGLEETDPSRGLYEMRRAEALASGNTG